MAIVEQKINYPNMVIGEEEKPAVLDKLHQSVHYISASEEVQNRIDDLTAEDLSRVFHGFIGRECLNKNLKRVLEGDISPNGCECALCISTVPYIRNYH